jgi:autotransporter-associated beta strand protein
MKPKFRHHRLLLATTASLGTFVSRHAGHTLALCAILLAPSLHAADGIWSSSASGSAWLTAGNWTDSIIPGSTSDTTNTDWALFATNTQPTVGLNMNTLGGTYYLGAIHFNNSTARNIGNSSSTAAGTLTLNGTTLNSVADTILWNEGTGLLTLQRIQSSGLPLGLELGNATNNIVQITGTGGITIASDISGTDRKLTRQGSGSGILILSGTNTYTGGTDIAGGLVQFKSTVSMPSTGAITVGTGAGIIVDVTGSGRFTNATSGAGSLGGILAGLGAGDSTITYDGDVTIGIDISSGGATTYAGNIANVTGSTSTSLFKINGQNLTLTGTNTYTGKTIINGGGLLVGTIGNVGSTTSQLGSGSTVEFINSGELEYRGAGETSNRIIDIVGTAGVLRTTANTGALVLTADITPTSSVNKTLGLTGSNTLANTISGNISNGAGGTLAVSKGLAGTWFLSGTNTYTGATTLSGGRLVIAGTAALPSASQLTWTGNTTTLQIQNDSHVALANTLSTSGRNLTRTLVVDRLTEGAAIDLTLNTARPNIDNNSVWNFQNGANVTSGTPTITFANGTGSSDSNNATIGGGTNFGPITFNPTGVNVVINSGITSSGRTRAYIFQGDSHGNQVNGAIANGTGTVIEKRGAGTWTFTGNNAYAGSTTIKEGTLFLTGATQATTAITFESGGVLGLNTGVSVTASSAVVNLANGAIKVSGTTGDASYTLLTASSISGTPVLADPVDGYELQVVGNQLLLVETGAATPYETWAGPGVPFDGDLNGDGVANGLAFLLNASGPNANALDKLPTASEDAGGLVLTFQTLTTTARGTAQLMLEYSNSLAPASWTTVTVPGTAGVSTDGNVSFTLNGTGPLDVTATISAAAANGGKLFARLKATGP